MLDYQVLIKNPYRGYLDLMQHSAVSDIEIIFSELTGQLIRITKLQEDTYQK